MSAIISDILGYLYGNFEWFKTFHEWADGILDAASLIYTFLGLIIAIAIYFVIKKPFGE